MVKHTLYKASEKAKLLAYIGLCRPHVEYAAAVWDPNLEYIHIAHDIEMIQHNNAARFIAGLEDRDSITPALENLYLETLAARHGKTRHYLLLNLLTNKENHNSLINIYEDLMDTSTTNLPTTTVAARGDPTLYMLKHQHPTQYVY